MLESVVSARGKVLRTNFSATSRVTRATKLTQAASRHSYRWCSPVLCQNSAHPASTKELRLSKSGSNSSTQTGYTAGANI